jgi:hypothetical protein
VNTRDIPDALPQDMALCLFRIAQEGLRNARHAGAGRAEICLRRLDGGLELAVKDDGAVTMRECRFLHIAAPDVCDGTSAVGESRHRIPGASVGQPTEPCLGRVLINRDCGASYAMSAMPPSISASSSSAIFMWIAAASQQEK